VHRLQGAERPIILFSLVYGTQDGNTGFIDSKVNLLNVAVSRAQHSFLLFGNMDALRTKGNQPSAHLARQLLSEGDNEMRFPLTPRRNLLAQTGTKHLSTLEAHRAMLHEAFVSAQQDVLIVSPFLARRALEEDKVPEMVREAVTRGVAVEIYSDSTFHKSPESKARLNECVEILRQAGAQVSLVERFHNKTLIVDDFILVEGSFNWFSASRTGTHVRQEQSIRYASSEVAGIKQKTKKCLAKRPLSHA
jgi:phosphatidylserine/phosphatidylglycerophosphate/cardiolipin synthase-like enzyme